MVAYVRHGRAQWHLAAGVASRATDAPAHPWDRVRIGSNTKAFVSTVLLQLEAEHRLSLNDTVSRWLPGLVSGHGNNGSKITIRELLDHTSGLYNYTDDPRVIAPYLNGDRIISGRRGSWSRSPSRTRRCSRPAPPGPTPTPITYSPG